jgi:mono/diheme cytochrome c family protein
MIFFLFLGAIEAQARTPSEARGNIVYQTHCTSCHHSEPKRNGSLGPAVAGASEELLRARILEGKYPEGYKPKRQTKIMVPLPTLKEEIKSLYLYLNQPSK